MKLEQKISFSVLLIALFLTPVLSLAQGFDYQEISIDMKASEESVAAGGSGELIITITVPYGYSITDVEGVFDITPMKEIEGLTFGDLIKPEHDKVDDIGGHFQDSSEFRLPFTLADDFAEGDITVVLGFVLQACNDENGVCYMPTRPEDMQRKTTFTVTGKADAAAAGSSLEDQFSAALSGNNLWMAFLLAFVAGIISSLTPCVYPMIPITISYVSGVSEGKKRNGFFISLVLVLGIAITYSILGVLAGMTGGTFGAYLGHPVVQAFLLVVLVAMGLSMLGVWEIRLPAALTKGTSTTKTGYIGALFVGLTLGIVAAPCVGPILVAMLLFIAQTQNLVLGLLLMFTYAVGMGLLFIVVGTFSNSILPKSGNWMIMLKKVFAFVFFVMAVYYSEDLLNMIFPELTNYIYGILLVLWGTTVGAFFKLEKEATAWEIVGKALGILLVTSGLILFAGGMIKPLLPQSAGNYTTSGQAESENASFPSPPWMRDFQAAVTLAEESGKPLLVDVGAEWCIACHELDEFTFSDQAVITELERFVVVKVDEADADYENVRKHFADRGYPIVGLPAVFIHDSEGSIVDVVNQFIPADKMMERIQNVK